MKKSSTRKTSRKPAAPTGKNALAFQGVRAAKDAIKRLKAGLRNARKLAKRFKKQLKAAKQTLKAASKSARRLKKSGPKADRVVRSRPTGKVQTRKKSTVRRPGRASKPATSRKPSFKKRLRPVPPAAVKKAVMPVAASPTRRTRPGRPADTAISKPPESHQAPAPENPVEASVAFPGSESVEPPKEPGIPA